MAVWCAQILVNHGILKVFENCVFLGVFPFISISCFVTTMALQPNAIMECCSALSLLPVLLPASPQLTLLFVLCSADRPHFHIAQHAFLLFFLR
jgi:hypothetical protein